MTARSDMQLQGPPAPASEQGEGCEPEPPLSSSRMTVDVVMDDEVWPGFDDAEAVVQAAVAALAHYPGVINEPCAAVVALSDDAEVARLNAAYRKKPTATNVLSFPAAPHPTSAGEASALGDIILARETILREAAESGTEPVHHLQHLVIHGLLHLLGHDHVDDAGAERMEALETAILATLQIPDPYSQSPISGGPQ